MINGTLGRLRPEVRFSSPKKERKQERSQRRQARCLEIEFLPDIGHKNDRMWCIKARVRRLKVDTLLQREGQRVVSLKEGEAMWDRVTNSQTALLQNLVQVVTTAK